MKHLHRLIVTSATYQQSAAASDELRARDDQNVLYARGPRDRLSAEMIRDNALAVSGLLKADDVGGESIKPYQPKGLWESVTGARYKQDTGDKLYRRGLYVYWKRGVPYPSMVTFDATLRESCATQRVHTNTPLQALVLMNDPVYVEAARHLGQQMITQGGTSTASRLALGYRLCTSRLIEDRELEILLQAHARLKARFDADEEAAGKLLEVGESKPAEGADKKELATWTALGSLLLNLDATIHKG